MINTKHSIYRVDAVRRYLESKEHIVLPRMISPRVFVYMWILLGLLISSGLVAWLMRVPVYASGLAIVMDSGQQNRSADQTAIVIFLPPESLNRLRTGQAVLLQLEAGGEFFHTSVIAVEPDIASPALAKKRYALDSSTALAINHPSAIAVAQWGGLPRTLPASSYVGGAYHVVVEIGSRRVISLLPFISQLLGE